VAVSCEHANEDLVSIAFWEILRVAGRLTASEEGLSSMELFTMYR
jgi:hypothetical protein